MNYNTPSAVSVNFDLSENAYIPSLYAPPLSYAYTVPVADAVNFDLSEQEYIPAASFGGDGNGVTEPPPSINYPIPPTLMSMQWVGVLLTSENHSTGTLHSFRSSPTNKDVLRSIRNGAASANENDSATRHEWDRISKKDNDGTGVLHGWGFVAGKQVVENQPWNRTLITDDKNGSPNQAWDGSISQANRLAALPWNVPAQKDATDLNRHSDSAKYWGQPAQTEGSPLYIATLNFDLSAAPALMPQANAVNFDLMTISSGGSEPQLEAVTPTRPVDAGRNVQRWETNTPTDSRFRHPWDAKPRIGSEVDWDYDQEPPLPDKDPADVPEIKEAYLYMNASSLKKMPEGIPLEFADLQISLDIDSFSWAMSASILNSASMDQIKPGPSGPVEVEAKVNNKTWRFMIERYTVTSKHPKTAYKVSGSSLTQLLAAPYSAKQSAQITTPTNALQVIQSILENTGFEIDWDVSLADYTIPAGAWGYENKTPIEVIDELVKAAGGVLIPATALSKLYAAQRYREAPPWYWSAIDSSSLDFQIADSTVASLSSEWQPTTEYRGVYVSGITQGVAVDVKKNGSDGLPRAPDVYDALNLTTQQCRGRGISILGQSGAQEIVTVELPLPTSGAPGLVVPGKWGEIQDSNDSENNWRALVLSTTVSVSRPGASRAMQTIRLERHHY